MFGGDKLKNFSLRLVIYNIGRKAYNLDTRWQLTCVGLDPTAVSIVSDHNSIQCIGYNIKPHQY